MQEDVVGEMERWRDEEEKVMRGFLETAVVKVTYLPTFVARLTQTGL